VLSNRTRKKTTVYVDEEVLRAAKVYAARKDIRDSEVIETVLREYLGSSIY
jgi:hypothetical protein